MLDFALTHDFMLSKDSPCYIIAEIGQNHQGNLDIAKQLIVEAKACGADCVKFQKSCLSEKFNRAALNRPYDNPHSWGTTYGEHKEFLEFSVEEFQQLQRYAHSVGITFTASAMDSVSVDVLNKMNVPFLKIGSGDANNFPLLEYAASKKRPLIVSTGMQNMDTVRDIYTLLKSLEARFCLLHCVSSYPVPPEQVNLRVIETYKSEFPDVHVGYSGHEMGTTISIGAVAMGAKILERHLTLDSNWKGTDHKSSLTPKEFQSMVQQIRLLERAFGSPIKRRQTCEEECFLKLGKTIVAAHTLQKGDTITKDNIKIKVAEPKGCSADTFNCILGRTVTRTIQADESISIIDIT